MHCERLLVSVLIERLPLNIFWMSGVFPRCYDSSLVLSVGIQLPSIAIEGVLGVCRMVHRG